jgi:hypothetical protein
VNLIRFRDYLGKKSDGKSPPSVIKAKDLDDNFAMLQLNPDKFGIYQVEKSDKGSTLKFRAANRDALWVEVDICENGVPKKIKVLATNPY